MTANRKRKKLIRARSTKTGESYTTARSFFRKKTAEKLPLKLQTITWRDLGIALDVRDDWQQLGPYLTTTDLNFDERIPVSRFLSCDSAEHVNGLLTIDILVGTEGLHPGDLAKRAQRRLESDHFEHFHMSATTIADQPASLLSCDFRYPDYLWSLRHYYVPLGQDRVLALSFGTRDVSGDIASIEDTVDSVQFIDKIEPTTLSEMALLYYNDEARQVLQAAQQVMQQSGDRSLLPMHILHGLSESHDEAVNRSLESLGFTSNLIVSQDQTSSGASAIVEPALFRTLTQTIPAIANGVVHPIHMLAGFLPAADDLSEPPVDEPPKSAIEYRIDNVAHLKASYNLKKKNLRLGLFEYRPKVAWTGQGITVDLHLMGATEPLRITETIQDVYEHDDTAPGRGGLVVLNIEHHATLLRTIESYLS